MDQLKAMEIFVEVARQRSFSGAARRLGMTRAMVSKHVIALEERLNARLLHRSTRDVSLTDAGQAYLEPCALAVLQAHLGLPTDAIDRVVFPGSSEAKPLADLLRV